MAEPFLHQVERDAGGDGRQPEPCRSPLGEAGTPSSPAACITACTARHPVIRDHGRSHMPRPLPRLACSSQMPCTISIVSSRAGGTGGECQGSCRLNYVMIPPTDEAAALAAQLSVDANLRLVMS